MNVKPHDIPHGNTYGNITPYRYNSQSITLKHGNNNYQPYSPKFTSHEVKNFLLAKFIRTITDKNFNGDLSNFIPEFISELVSNKINNSIVTELTSKISKNANIFVKYGLFIGDKSVCEDRLNDFLKDNNAFRIENSLITQGYCNKVALLNAIPVSNSGQIILKSAMQSHISMTPQELFDLTPNSLIERSFLEKTGDIVAYGNSYVQAIIASIYKTSQLPGEIVGEMLTNGYLSVESLTRLMLNSDIEPEGIETIKNEFIQQELLEIAQLANINEADSPLLLEDIKYEFTPKKDTIPESRDLLYDDLVSTETLMELGIEHDDICKNATVDLEIDTEDNFLKYSNTVYSYASIVKEGLDWIAFFTRLNEMSDKQIVRYFLARFLVFVSYDSSISYGNVLVTLATFIETGKIRVEEALAVGVQLLTGVPCMGTFRLLGDLLHKGKTDTTTVVQCAVEIACFVYPPLRVVVVLYQIGTVVYYYYKDYDVDNDKKVYGLGVSIVTCRTWKGWLTWKREARLKMPLLDIDIKTFGDSNEKSKEQALDIAKIQVKDRAYSYLGISYIFLDENYSRSKTRLDNYRFALLYEILNNNWKTVANMTPEELAIYENFTQAKEDKDRRIDLQIRGKIDSFYNLHKNETVVTFIAGFIIKLQHCKNNTEIAFTLFNLFSETGRDKGKQIKITGHLKSLLIYFGVDVSTLEGLINYQKDLTQEQYDKEKDKINENEYNEFYRLVHNLRNGLPAGSASKRLPQPNRKPLKKSDKNLKDTETTEISDYENGEGNYTVKNIIIYANKRLFQIEISMGYAVGTVVSGTNSVLISSVAYLDKELLAYSNGPIIYFPNKIKQICVTSLQNYMTNVISSHISLSISLLPALQHIDDDYFKYIFIPNCNLLVTYSMSSLCSHITKSDDGMNKGQRVFSRINNTLRTNISSINEMLKDNTKIADELSKIITTPLNYLVENTPEMIKEIIAELKDSRALNLVFNSIRTTLEIIKPKMISMGAKFIPTFVQNNILGITAMVGFRIIEGLVFWYKLPKIDWKLVYEYEVFNRESNKMMTLVKILEDEKANSQDKDLITTELMIKGYIENIPLNTDIYDASENIKTINIDTYYGVNNPNQNTIDTKIKPERMMMIDTKIKPERMMMIDTAIEPEYTMPMIEI